jgi:hypothetical protein
MLDYEQGTMAMEKKEFIISMMEKLKGKIH